MSSGPIRTCFGCGHKGPQKSMLRLAVQDGQVVLDKEYKLSGRGVYSCNNQECLALSVKNKKKLAWAFRAVEDSLEYRMC